MFQHLRKSYGRDSDWAGEVIKMSRFIWASDRESEKADSIKGAKIAEVFETLDGIRSQYEFMAVDSGIVAYRQNGCWCNACMQVRGRGEGFTAKSGDDPQLIVPGCPRPELPWREGDVTRKEACGVRAGVAEARAFGQKPVEDGIRVGQWRGAGRTSGDTRRGRPEPLLDLQGYFCRRLRGGNGEDQGVHPRAH